jgi:tetratricopeptide (TPR) repeat protein
MRAMVLSIGLSVLAWAAPTRAENPQLVAREMGIDDEEASSRALRVADLHVVVDVVGALADVTLTVRFANPSEDTLEGDFSMDLPAGAVVTGYALDIEERMVEGVLVEPLKAERAYENQVREGIDPGVAKVSRANRFSTRVFPIPEKGSRTIRVKFSSALDPSRGLTIPLETVEAVGRLTIAARASGVRSAPRLTLPNGLLARWGRSGDAWLADATAEDLRLAGRLQLAGAVPQHEALATRHPNGKRFVHIADRASRVDSPGPTSRRVRVYWDHSRSRRDQDLSAERALLARYLQGAPPLSIDLVTFNSSGARVTRVDAAKIEATLKRLTYRGATSYSMLAGLSAPPADLCLLFTDGVSTIDERMPFDPACEMFVISSAADADRGFLRRLAKGRADAVLALNRDNREQVLRRLLGGGVRVVRVMTEDGRDLAHAMLDSGGQGWSVITEAPASGPVVLRIAGVHGGIVERHYLPWGGRGEPFAAGGALWARDQAALLASSPESHAEFVALCRRYSIAGAELSFLVLEEPGDYVMADVEPPPSYPTEWREAYRELKARHDAEQRQMREERLGEVQRRWGELVAWWNTSFDPNAPKKQVPMRSRMAPAPAGAGTPAREASPAVDAITAEDIGRFPDNAASNALQRGGDLEEVIVTGLRGSMMTAMEAHRHIQVQMAEWKVDRPYVAALDAAAPADVDRVLAAQENEFGQIPAFYFDTAEWFHRRQRVPEALELLLSALDLPLANEETASMVAERLLRYGQVDRAIGLLERLARQTDYLPQPRRSLALALVRRATLAEQAGDGATARADLERALQLLAEVIMTPWEESFDGIEVIALVEANALVPRLEKLGARRLPLDRTLRTVLDVDLRVVIEWNTLATDMDLWVHEPNGELAFYSNAQTAIGGRLSNDMTEGLGPEEYLLRRAARGEYQVSVNVYGNDRLNPNGTTVVTARLFRDFGRPTQSEETMEIELQPDAEGQKLIGRFTVE